MCTYHGREEKYGEATVLRRVVAEPVHKVPLGHAVDRKEALEVGRNKHPEGTLHRANRPGAAE